MTTRRGFLAALLAAGAAPSLGWASVGNPAYLAAAREPDGGHALFGLDLEGGRTFRVALPARGHAGAGHPVRAEAVAFARRPGTFALVIDCASGVLRHHLTPPAHRQFNGHGVFALEGTRLFTSEQVGETSAGVIGVWDVEAGYTRIGEVPSHGIGPHDLRLMPDGATLVVANGGIATDPADRTKLNIGTMRPNLAYLGLDGALLDQVALSPELRQNSIRHLAIRPDGLVAFGMQWEGAEGAAPPLLGLHRRGAVPVLASAPLADELVMQGYAGSIAFSGGRDDEGGQVAITSPRGGRVHRFTPEGDFLGAVSRSDVCGLAPHPDGLLASDGFGGLVCVGSRGASPVARWNLSWDNHIVRL